MQSISVETQRQIEQCLMQKGFSPEGHNSFDLDGICHVFDHGWPTLEQRVCPSDSMDSAQAQSCRPGLWKVVERDGVLKEIFEFPPDLLSGPSQEDRCSSTQLTLWEDALSWATAAASSPVSLKDWSAPALTDFKGSESDLIVQVGRFIRRGYWIREDHHLAIRIPVNDDLPVSLNHERMLWLQATLLDGQSRWRLVRLVLDTSQRSVVAELDFTGASHQVIRSILPVGVTCLRKCVAWLAASVDAIANAQLEADIFQVCETLI